GESSNLSAEVQTLTGTNTAPEADEWTQTLISPTSVESSSGGSQTAVRWNAVGESDSFFQTPERRVVALRLRASDSDGVGEWTESAPFVVGNSAPSAEFTPETRSALAMDQVGQVLLEFTLSDQDMDPAAIALEYRTAGSSTWLDGTAAIVAGSTVGLATDEITRHFLVWNSASGTGGLGTIDTLADIRIVPRDDPDGDGEDEQGTEAQLSNIQFLNFSRPRLDGVRATRGDVASGQSPIAIVYSVSDASSALLDVDFEFSTDTGFTFAPCQEYVGVLSEGRSQLESSPSGLEHIFVWDPVGAFFAPEQVILRLTVAQSQFPDVTSVVQLPLLQAVGPQAQDTGVLGEVGSVSVSAAAGQAFHDLKSGDFNEDGHLDFAAFARTRDGENCPTCDTRIFVFLGDGNGSFSPHPTTYPMGTRPFRPNVNSDGQTTFLAIADVDRDSSLDIVTVGDPNAAMAGVTVLFGDGTGAFPDSRTLVTSTDCQRVLAGPFTAAADFEFLAICSN
ncbi:MAG: VCBS repeat-containing protein, partial [Myxococcota bacterium]